MRGGHRRWRLGIIPCLILLLDLIARGALGQLTIATTQSTAGPFVGTWRVLVINSYNPGYLWSDQEMQGFYRVIQDQTHSIDLRVEFLDWKRFPFQGSLNNLRELFQRKYAGIHIDLIVAMDDPALDFAVANRQQLFSSAPIVFCGINGYHEIARTLPADVTGVAEALDVAGTLKTAFALQPHATDVLVVADSTETGLIIQRQAQAASQSYLGRARFRYTPGNSTLESMLHDVESVPKDGFILLGSFHRDWTGRFIGSRELVRVVTEHSHVPVYHLWTFGLGDGVTGGDLLSGDYQGQRAGEMALQILHGTPVSAIPVDTHPPTPPIFDYRELQRFGISPSALPPGSTVLFRPISFYNTHTELVWTVVAIVLVQGAVIIVLLINVQRRQRAERALRDSEHWFRAMAEASFEGLAFSQGGILVDLNEQYAKMLGYEREEMLGRPVLEFFAPGSREKVKQALTQKQMGPYEADAMCKDGRTTPVEIRARMGYLHRRETRIASLRDLRLRKEAEAERQRLLESERNARLQAETAMHAKDQFLAMVSHELRTPLTPVLPAVEMLLGESGVSSNAKELLQAIRDSIHAETQLVSDLLDMTRMGTGGLTLKRERMELTAVVRQCLEIYRDAATEKRLRLDLENVCNGVVVEADPVRLRQVVCNLLANAVKFTPEEGRIRVRCDIERPGWATVDVEDSGVGMEKGVLDRIFMPFEQADPTITRRFGGMGLGLYVSRTLMEMHGGTLTAQSPGPGKGSTFRLTLPAAGVQTAQGSGSGVGGPKVAPQKRFKVLLVEDNPTTLRLFAQFLEKQGHQVFRAGDAQAAMRVLDENTVDVLVSDLGLPEVSGWELMRKVHQRKAVAGIAVSGFSTEADIQRSREAGFDRHLVKPVNMAQLAKTIQEVAAPSRY